MTSELEAFHVLYLAYRLVLGMDKAGSMGMQVHHFRVHEFLGLKFIVNGIDNLGGHDTAGIAQG